LLLRLVLLVERLPDDLLLEERLPDAWESADRAFAVLPLAAWLLEERPREPELDSDSAWMSLLKLLRAPPAVFS
jgi:hypothetical protein